MWQGPFKRFKIAIHMQKNKDNRKQPFLGYEGNNKFGRKKETPRSFWLTETDICGDEEVHTTAL